MYTYIQYIHILYIYIYISCVYIYIYHVYTYIYMYNCITHKLILALRQPLKPKTAAWSGRATGRR